MVYYNNMEFVWDKEKASTNIKKHKISFKQAEEAMKCKHVVVLKEDDDHPEQRFACLGMCSNQNILVVIVTYPSEEVTRIISARKAIKKERCDYESSL